jgi:protein-tyrosine phosphatase
LPGRTGFEVEVASAGTSALEGTPASGSSIEVAKAHGLDLSHHRSRVLDRSMVRDADLIVTMGVRHRETVGTLDPDALEYTYLLTNFSDHLHGEIVDPIGGGLDMYERTYLAIRECIDSMAGRLARFDGWKRVQGGTS